MSEKREFAIYHVGLKILLKKGDNFLFLKDAKNLYFDLPGGRIDSDEHRIPLEAVLDREVKEELGEELNYELGEPLFQFRKHWDDKNMHTFLTVYKADYVSGEIKLSQEHSGFEWLDPKDYNFKEEEFFSKEEYLAFQKYFNEPVA